MKNIIKTLLIVMTLAIALVALASCEFTCVHEGGVATCEDAGVCTKCGEAYIDALGHKTGFTTPVAATCTEDGVTASSYCITCGEVFIEAEVVEALGHDYKDVAEVAATCTEGGHSAYKVCDRCGYTDGKVTYDALGHDWVSLGFDEENVETLDCANCDETKTQKVQLPEAVVTPIENPDLTFSLNFGIKGVSIVDGELVIDSTILSDAYLEAVLAEYGNYYVDYVLTIEGLASESVIFNSSVLDESYTGNANACLGGQYDAWSSSWVYVPFEDTALKNNESLYIMETAAAMMGQSGLRYTLAEIVSVVIDFDCGVYFTPEFLAANPDMVVTLQLVVFTEDTDGNIADNHIIAENVFTAK